MKLLNIFTTVVLSSALISTAFASDGYQQIRNATGKVEIANKNSSLTQCYQKIPILALRDPITVN